jgi:xylulose-5-phosphate/fructose-6-phosphate phosphoketolase
MLVLRTPKGWTGPREVNGVPVENTWRSHQVPLSGVRGDAEQLRRLEDWLRSYRPEELFDEEGRVLPEILAQAPEGERRLSANPHANGGELLRDLVLPDFRDYAVEVKRPGADTSEATRVLGSFLRDIMARNPTRPRRTGSATSSRSRTRRGWRRHETSTSTSPRTAACSRSSPSISARAGSRATS